MVNTKELYKTKVRTALQEKFNYKNPHQIPQLVKLMVHMGIAKVRDKNQITDLEEQLYAMTGQKPVTNYLKQSISGFGAREGQPVGLMVTLRGKSMFRFLDMFLAVNLPRMSNFRGLKRKGDGQGNVSFGFPSQQFFIELDHGDVKTSQGFMLTFVTTSKTDAGALELLDGIGVPFHKGKQS